MARTFNEIKQDIIDSKNGITGLSVLNSTSNTAIWNLMVDAVATVLVTEDQLLDLFKSDVKTTLENNIVGTSNWLRSKSLEFQFDSGSGTGDPLIIDNFSIKYGTVDTNKRIITQASVTESDRLITIRVVKGSAPFSTLTSTELSAFKSYIKQIQFAGQYISCVSLESDKLFIQPKIYFDGIFGETNVQNNVKTAIQDFLNATSFAGTISVSKLIDSIQAVAGVKDVVIEKLYARDNATAITSAAITKIIDLVNTLPTQYLREYETQAGYIVLETTSGFQFDDVVEMISI